MRSSYLTVRSRNAFMSVLVHKKALLVIAVLILLVLAAIISSAGLGDMLISPINVFKVLIGQGSSMETLFVKSFRLPRILVSLLAGMSLAVSGGILQGLVRNPLASPDIIGLTAGASAAVVSFLTIFSDQNNALTVSIAWLPLAAFSGAMIAALLAFVLSYKNGISPLKLVLIGLGLSAVYRALTTFMMILGPIYRASQANIWITGTVYGSTWTNVSILFAWTTPILIVSFLMTRHLNVQELGSDMATGLGSNVQRYRAVFLLLSTALTGGAVAFAGGIGFVGLIAPHIARRLVGSSFGALLVAAALIGGLMVMSSDLIGRTLFSPMQVPAGVFTALIGAPYFIYLLYKTRNR